MSAPITYAGHTWPSAREWCLWIMQHNAAPGPAQNGQRAALDAHRAEVLRAGAALVEDAACDADWSATPAYCAGMRAAVALLSQAAEEKSSPAGADATPELTVFRASHDAIVMGRYTTAAEARKHCETEERRSWPTGTNLAFDWIEDEEDGVAELVVVAGQNEESVTGYVVTPLEIAAAYETGRDLPEGGDGRG